MIEPFQAGSVEEKGKEREVAADELIEREHGGCAIRQEPIAMVALALAATLRAIR